MTDTFYRTFSEKQLTSLGGARRGADRARRAWPPAAHATPPGPMLEIGPGRARWRRSPSKPAGDYSAVEPSPMLAERLRAAGLERRRRPGRRRFRGTDASYDVLYADQVLEHMSGIDAARAFTAEALRVLRPGGVVLHRRARLPEGARLFLGHRLHAQLPDHRTARAPAAL